MHVIPEVAGRLNVRLAVRQAHGRLFAETQSSQLPKRRGIIDVSKTDYTLRLVHPEYACGEDLGLQSTRGVTELDFRDVQDRTTIPPISLCIGGDYISEKQLVRVGFVIAKGTIYEIFPRSKQVINYKTSNYSSSTPEVVFVKRTSSRGFASLIRNALRGDQVRQDDIRRMGWET